VAIIPTLRKLKQKNHVFQVSLSYKARPYLKRRSGERGEEE
jgi:hypothetical protein